MSITPETLGDAFPRELQRNRELLEAYRGLGITGMFAAMMIAADITEAVRALAENDVVAMLRVYPRLRDAK